MPEQLETVEHIKPIQLARAMDGLLERTGRIQRNGSVMAEYIYPGTDYGERIESRPFGRIGRHPGHGSSYYTVESIVPHNGGSVETLRFEGDRVITNIDVRVQIGEHDQEHTREETELTSKEIKELFDEVSDPSLIDRDDEIEAFYRKRHEARGKIGRLVARARNTDKPRYF